MDESEDLNDDLIGGALTSDDDDDLLLDDDLDTPLKFDEEEEDPDSRFH